MDTLASFANGLLSFVLAAVKLFVNFIIYILEFIVRLLQQLLSAIV